jgi:hypothetical protein
MQIEEIKDTPPNIKHRVQRRQPYWFQPQYPPKVLNARDANSGREKRLRQKRKPRPDSQRPFLLALVAYLRAIEGIIVEVVADC